MRHPLPERCMRPNGLTKSCYRSRSHARHAAKALAQHAKLYTYECRWCGHWHLTSRPPRND